MRGKELVALLLQHINDDLQDPAADAGRLRLHPEPVHVADVLVQATAAHRAGAEAAGVTLTTGTDGTPALTADPVRLRQAIGNLVSNAVRHTPVGGVVAVHCHQHDQDVVVTVTDSGTGIAAEDFPKVFDRFWRADKSRTRRTGGSGLGLPIVRRLVRAHGGDVTASSVLGEGSVFTIRLPRHPMPDPCLPADGP
jgi:two-component system sensor histidine kinase BaeS